MPEIIKQEVNTTPLTKLQEHKNLRAHLMMLLEAMQYKGPTDFMDNGRLRELVEEQKIIFIRKMQEQLNARLN